MANRAGRQWSIARADPGMGIRQRSCQLGCIDGLWRLARPAEQRIAERHADVDRDCNPHADAHGDAYAITDCDCHAHAVRHAITYLVDH